MHTTVKILASAIEKAISIEDYHEVYRSLAQFTRTGLTIGFESSRFAVSAACLVDSLDEKDVTGAALQAVDCVVILLDIGHDHPAIYRVIQTCKVRVTEHNINHKFSIFFNHASSEVC